MKTFMNPRASAVIAIVVLALSLVACGGGGSDGGSNPSVSPFSGPVVAQADGTAASRELAPQRFIASATLYGDATPLDAANQLMNFGETVFPQFFPTHEQDHQFGPIVFRYYPTAGTYLGVAINTVPGDGFSEGGVYVLGGPFGDVVTYIAPLTAFITPVAQLHYTDKVYAIWTNAYPYAVTKTGVARVVNKTHFPGLAPFFNCWLLDKQLVDGKVLTSCQESQSLARNVFYIDPTKDEMYDYTGQIPADAVWRDTAQFDPAKPEWGAKTHASDGWYFTTSNVTWVLNFQSDTTGQVNVVKAGTFTADQTVRLLMSYTN